MKKSVKATYRKHEAVAQRGAETKKKKKKRVKEKTKNRGTRSFSLPSPPAALTRHPTAYTSYYYTCVYGRTTSPRNNLPPDLFALATAALRLHVVVPLRPLAIAHTLLLDYGVFQFYQFSFSRGLDGTFALSVSSPVSLFLPDPPRALSPDPGLAAPRRIPPDRHIFFLLRSISSLPAVAYL